MTRVLFVDDEPRVLEGLRLGLRSKRKVWDMVFFEGACAALADVEQRPLDVVVSDMRMPQMDGAEFLARVATLRPAAARIILSGQMDETGAVRAASVAHRFLSKPCDPSMLESTITRAIELNGWLCSERVRGCIGGVESLPSPPEVYLALNRALADPHVSMSAVAQIIESDPGIAAKILQLVNSSFFGLPRRMVNIAHSASYLGIITMKNLALANSLFHELGGADAGAAERERERSLLRARIARRLFKDAARAESAATAGLLLDIGSLTLQSRMPAEYASNASEAQKLGVPVHEIERERLGVTHAEVGAYLLGLWGLPHEIIEAVAAHHAPWSDETTLDIQSAVRVADALSSSFLRTKAGGANDELSPELLARLGLTDVVRRLQAEILPTLS